MSASDQTQDMLSGKLDRLKAHAAKVADEEASDPENSRYWDGYLDALWYAIEVIEG